MAALAGRRALHTRLDVLARRAFSSLQPAGLAPGPVGGCWLDWPGGADAALSLPLRVKRPAAPTIQVGSRLRGGSWDWAGDQLWAGLLLGAAQPAGRARPAVSALA